MLSETNCASLLHLFRQVIHVQIGQYNFVCALNIFRQSIWKAMVCFPHVVIRDKLCFFTAPFQTSNWCSVTGQGITFLVALNIFRQSIWKMMVCFLRGLLTPFFFFKISVITLLIRPNAIRQAKIVKEPRTFSGKDSKELFPETQWRNLTRGRQTCLSFWKN